MSKTKKPRSPEAAAARIENRKREREQRAAFRAEERRVMLTLYPETQYYKNIPLKQVIRRYTGMKAHRYTLNGTNQNVWIPCKHLDETGRLLPGQNIDYVFLKSPNQCYYAGVTFHRDGAIIGEPIPNLNRR